MTSNWTKSNVALIHLDVSPFAVVIVILVFQGRLLGVAGFGPFVVLRDHTSSGDPRDDAITVILQTGIRTRASLPDL